MIASTISYAFTSLSTYLLAPMALFLWGFIWFVMSVIVFGLGRFIPAMRPKPPPAAAPRPRTQSPRISPKPLPPVPVPLEPTVAEVDVVSCESAPSDRSSSMTSETPSANRPQYKSKWSFSSRLKQRRPSGSSSPRPSFVSAGSSTLVDTSSPSRYVPELPVIESESSSDPRPGKDDISPASPSPTGSPRPSRHVRLPSMKMFKNLSRRMSKQKSEVGSSPTSSKDNSVDDIVRVLNDRAAFSEEPASDHDLGKEAPSDHHPVLPRNNSLSGEVFTSTFVNPFRTKSRKAKTPPPPLLPAPPQRSPKSRRPFAHRMLTSIHIASAEASAAAAPDSPHSSLSSSSSFSSPSFPSATTGTGSPSPRGPARTQPYGPPYYAAMPRRATSLSLERPETVVEESDEEASNNALGLELGRRPARGLGLGLGLGQSEPRRRRPLVHHRSTASESTATATATAR